MNIDKYMTATPETLGHDQTLATAHQVMRKHKIRHLPVLDCGKLVGLVTERDLHLLETLKDVDPSDVKVEEAMTPDPYVVTSKTNLATVVRTMADHKYGSAIVVDRDRVVGVFTTIDALRALAEALEAKGVPQGRPTPKTRRTARETGRRA